MHGRHGRTQSLFHAQKFLFHTSVLKMAPIYKILPIYQPPETNEAFSPLQFRCHTEVPRNSRLRILKCYRFIGVCGEMALVLLQVLDQIEMNKLSKGVRYKLEIFVNELQNVNESLKRQHERLNVEYGVWVTF